MTGQKLLRWDRARLFNFCSSRAASRKVLQEFRQVLFGPSIALRPGMNEKAQALQQRTHIFFVRILSLCRRLPRNTATQRIEPQLIDAAGSTDSNYRAACRARSPAEFIAKIGVAAEEADESKGWLSALLASDNAPEQETRVLIQEADELTAIFAASRKTAERRLKERKEQAKQTRGRT